MVDGEGDDGYNDSLTVTARTKRGCDGLDQ
jgi:hypothetical protein